MNCYIRKVCYYETDKMGITHHSNYIKWMEEARIHFLNNLGFSYAKLEKEGIVSPVIGIECQYKKSTTFDDEIKITALIEHYSGAKLIIKYIMTNNKTNDLILTGTSTHCFINKLGNPVILKRALPEFDALLINYISNNNEVIKWVLN